MFRTYSFRLRPTRRQAAELGRILSVSCDLYNAALQERRDAWKMSGVRVTRIDQQRQLTEVRADDPEVRSVAVDIARDPLRRAERAFNAFFRRCRLGEKPGHPRFRSRSRYASFTFHLPVIKDGALTIPNLGSIRFKASRKINGNVRTATIVNAGKRWVAKIGCDLGPAPEKRAVAAAVGVDLGLNKFAVLSDGTAIDNPRWTKRHATRIASANQNLARKQKRSKNRARALEALRRAHQRTVDARRNFTHHVSKWIVSQFDLIVYENLNIKGMARGILAKSIIDAAWGELIWQISYKAESAGRWAIPVHPKGTTIKCSGCGERVPKALSQRVHSCPSCGLTLDRDHNAAINILALGMSAAGVTLQNVRGERMNPTSLSKSSGKEQDYR